MGGVDFLVQTYAMGGVDQAQRNGRINPILLGGTTAGIGTLELFIPCQYLGGDMWTDTQVALEEVDARIVDP